MGTYGSNGAGLSDMVGNVTEWTSDCREGDCGRRVLLGGSWASLEVVLGSGDHPDRLPGIFDREPWVGFRVSRTLD